MASGSSFPDNGIVLDAAVDTTATNGLFFGFQVFTSATIAAITTPAGYTGIQKLVGVTLSPGVYQMRFTSIRFSSGVVMLFGEN